MLNLLSGPDNVIMKHRVIFLTSLICCLLLQAASQSQPALPPERISLTSERDTYLTGEILLFAAVVHPKADAGSSRVLMVELLDAGGTQMVGVKTSIQQARAEGNLRIPADLISGYYFLRAYTRQMRNTGPSGYAWKLIKVVNPHINETIQGDDSLVTLQPTAAEAVSVHLDNEIYATRSAISFSLKTLVPSAEISSVSVAVVPAAALLNTNLTLPAQPELRDNQPFMPETKGVSLSGTVVDAATGEIAADVLVSLTMVDHSRDFMARKTDQLGRFFFTLPDGTGEHDLFICPPHHPGTTYKLLIDQDFCTLPVRLPLLKFEADSAERISLLQMASNQQLGTYYASMPDEVDEGTVRAKPFYGIPDDVVEVDRYVALPTLEEYFNELPGMAKVKKKNGLRYFKVMGTSTALSVYEPLVMVDYVAIDDPERVLSMAPAQLSRIEVINEPYIKGDLIYGGIISLITKRGDFGGIDLPSSGLFFSYELFQDDGFTNGIHTGQNQPDTRNILQWWPHLQLPPSTHLPLHFNAADTPGTFAIVVLTHHTDGSLKRTVKHFLVRD